MIIDGLDECELPERKQILEYLVQLVTQCDLEDPGKLRLLLVSQDHADIRRILHSSTNTRTVPRIVALSPAHNENDIRSFVNHRAGEIRAEHGLDADQTEYLKELTVQRAQGNLLTLCCGKITPC